jgi:acetoin utilization protein AcuB
MTPNPIVGYPDMPVPEAQELMIEKGIRHLPILDTEQKIVGVITQRSLLSALPSDVSRFSRFEIQYTLSKIKVRDVMTKDVITIGEDTPIEEAARVMADEKIGCLPVMERDHLVGIITDNDLFTVMVDLLGGRRPGVRLTVSQPDRAGEVARLTQAIDKKGGYISVIVTYPETEQTWASVCRIRNVSKEELIDIIVNLADTRIQDVREMNVLNG